MGKYAGNSYKIDYEYKTAASGNNYLKGQQVRLVAGSLASAVEFAMTNPGLYNPAVPADALVIEHVVAARVEAIENSVAVDTDLDINLRANIWKVSYDVTKSTGIQKGVILVCAGDVEKAAVLAQDCLGLQVGQYTGTSSGLSTLWSQVFEGVANKPATGELVTIWSIVRDGATRWSVGVNDVVSVSSITIVGSAEVPVASGAATVYIGEYDGDNISDFTLTTDTGTPAPTIKSVIWTSSDPSKASINASGILHPLAAGTTTITAAAIDGSGVTASFVATIEAGTRP